MNFGEGLNVEEELRIRKILNDYLAQENVDQAVRNVEQQASLRRLRAKLNLRQIKRNRHLKLFDIDSFTNELIDQERTRLKRAFVGDVTASATNLPDVIFEYKTLKTNAYETTDSKAEVIEITRVLDRFKKEKPTWTVVVRPDIVSYLDQMPIGMVESRNEDIKCLVSPFTNKMLKPYIWRDFKSMPPKLKLSQLIKSRQNNPEIFKSSSIDYVHLRPEHVLHINSMCERHFWNGIDVSECLQYPDYTIVALYKKLIVGFAFMVPLTAQNQQQQQPKQMTSAPIDPNRREMYLSFIFVHSDWRESNRVAKLNDQDENETSCNISIAQYMLFYLIKSCDCDITLHVSVNSPAVILYQKFGFQIDEYIQDFYDKYYTYEHNTSKNAFLMRLSR